MSEFELLRPCADAVINLIVIIKKVILPTITLPECQRNVTFLMIFAVFWSVAVNTMDKLQFLVLIFAVLLSKLCNVSLCNYTVYLNSFSIR